MSVTRGRGQLKSGVCCVFTHPVVSAAHIRRQAIIGFRWMEDSTSAFKACWFTSDPAPYRAVTQAWDDHSAFLDVGYGAWHVAAGTGGGSVVSYQLWATARMVPAQVTAWVLSQGLPDVVREYEAHVGQVTASR